MQQAQIGTLSEYFDVLRSIKRIDIYGHTISCRTFFRGQSDANWGLSPRLFRENLFGAEGILVKRLLHHNPSEFGENKFENLAKMQHYGLPTRLLDCTSNPLVALYFACVGSSQAEKDGSVLVFPNMPTYWCTDPMVEIHVDYIFDHGDPVRVPIDKYFSIQKLKYAHTSAASVFETKKSFVNWLEVPLLTIIPRKNTQRLINQDGAFFLFGMHSSEYVDPQGKRNEAFCSFKHLDSKGIEELWGAGFSIHIPAKVKLELVDQLDILGINSEKLFPDLDHQTVYVQKNVPK